MILFAFILFAMLVVAWAAAPAGAGEEAKAPAAPTLKMSETPA
jgi:hypothetical protein